MTKANRGSILAWAVIMVVMCSLVLFTAATQAQYGAAQSRQLEHK